MKTWERYSFNIAAAIVAITGLVYFWMEYGMITDDPFAVINHPWQPHMLGLHVLAAPVLLVIFGIIFNSHIGRKLRSCQPNRRTGLLSLGTFALMTLSGYLLQIVSAPGARRVCLILHLVTGAVFAVSYTVHLVVGLRLEAKARTASAKSTLRADERLTA
jgi:hypothetical protein